MRTARFAWQLGYADLSVSKSNASAVCRYIADQKRHPKRMTFQREPIAFLKKHEIEYDERYIWGMMFRPLRGLGLRA